MENVTLLTDLPENFFAIYTDCKGDFITSFDRLKTGEWSGGLERFNTFWTDEKCNFICNFLLRGQISDRESSLFACLNTLRYWAEKSRAESSFCPFPRYARDMFIVVKEKLRESGAKRDDESLLQFVVKMYHEIELENRKERVREPTGPLDTPHAFDSGFALMKGLDFDGKYLSVLEPVSGWISFGKSKHIVTLRKNDLFFVINPSGENDGNLLSFFKSEEEYVRNVIKSDFFGSIFVFDVNAKKYAHKICELYKNGPPEIQSRFKNEENILFSSGQIDRFRPRTFVVSSVEMSSRNTKWRSLDELRLEEMYELRPISKKKTFVTPEKKLGLVLEGLYQEDEILFAESSAGEAYNPEKVFVGSVSHEEGSVRHSRKIDFERFTNTNKKERQIWKKDFNSLQTVFCEFWSFELMTDLFGQGWEQNPSVIIIYLNFSSNLKSHIPNETPNDRSPINVFEYLEAVNHAAFLKEKLPGVFGGANDIFQRFRDLFYNWIPEQLSLVTEKGFEIDSGLIPKKRLWLSELPASDYFVDLRKYIRDVFTLEINEKMDLESLERDLSEFKDVRDRIPHYEDSVYVDALTSIYLQRILDVGEDLKEQLNVAKRLSDKPIVSDRYLPVWMHFLYEIFPIWQSKLKEDGFNYMLKDTPFSQVRMGDFMFSGVSERNDTEDRISKFLLKINENPLKNFQYKERKGTKVMPRGIISDPRIVLICLANLETVRDDSEVEGIISNLFRDKVWKDIWASAEKIRGNSTKVEFWMEELQEYNKGMKPLNESDFEKFKFELENYRTDLARSVASELRKKTRREASKVLREKTGNEVVEARVELKSISKRPDSGRSFRYRWTLSGPSKTPVTHVSEMTTKTFDEFCFPAHYGSGNLSCEALVYDAANPSTFTVLPCRTVMNVTVEKKCKRCSGWYIDVDNHFGSCVFHPARGAVQEAIYEEVSVKIRDWKYFEFQFTSILSPYGDIKSLQKENGWDFAQWLKLFQKEVSSEEIQGIGERVYHRNMGAIIVKLLTGSVDVKKAFELLRKFPWDSYLDYYFSKNGDTVSKEKIEMASFSLRNYVQVVSSKVLEYVRVNDLKNVTISYLQFFKSQDMWIDDVTPVALERKYRRDDWDFDRDTMTWKCCGKIGEDAEGCWMDFHDTKTDTVRFVGTQVRGNRSGSFYVKEKSLFGTLWKDISERSQNGLVNDDLLKLYFGIQTGLSGFKAEEAFFESGKKFKSAKLAMSADFVDFGTGILAKYGKNWAFTEVQGCDVGHINAEISGIKYVTDTNDESETVNQSENNPESSSKNDSVSRENMENDKESETGDELPYLEEDSESEGMNGENTGENEEEAENESQSNRTDGSNVDGSGDIPALEQFSQSEQRDDQNGIRPLDLTDRIFAEETADSSENQTDADPITGEKKSTEKQRGTNETDIKPVKLEKVTNPDSELKKDIKLEPRVDVKKEPPVINEEPSVIEKETTVIKKEQEESEINDLLDREIEAEFRADLIRLQQFALLAQYDRLEKKNIS